ncbi:UDP-glucose 4-epimerase GalE [Variovorax sp. UC74_104]|uniref:UDP-glucose 4-epimerase GalE n=1 Tax=Variovorax sp. UC74_104 TaxID=3374555 RepID=UPI0037567137
MILVTGGTGYIGSHTCIELARAGHEFVVLDNFSNSTPVVLERMAQIIGRPIRWYEGDIRDPVALERIFAEHRVSAVLHFAGLKAVTESISRPIGYFDNNVHGSIALVKAMARASCKTLVFSSSATVYGPDQPMPVGEGAPCSVSNPYGRTKLVVEDLLYELGRADPEWRIATLRYFNPTGAHPSGLIGESPIGTPSNLMPLVCQVAAGLRPCVQIFGNDYPSPDGTGVRDFVHVMDLAEGHVAALDYLTRNQANILVNLGTGQGTSVLEVIRTFERVNGQRVPFEVVARRAADIGISYADASLARELLGWVAKRGIDDMCRDAWRWQSANRA